MNRDQLCRRTAKRAHITLKQMKIIYEALTYVIMHSNENIHLMDFGTFEIVQTKEQQVRSPITDEVYIVPPKKYIVFKPAQLYKDILNNQHK